MKGRESCRGGRRQGRRSGSGKEKGLGGVQEEWEREQEVDERGGEQVR